MFAVKRFDRSSRSLLFFKSNLRISQQSGKQPNTLRAFVEAPAPLQTKNGLRAARLIFRVNENFKRKDMKGLIKLLYWASVFAGIGAGFVYLKTSEVFATGSLIALSVGDIIAGYRMNKLNEEALAEHSRVLQQAHISEDGETLFLHDMVEDSRPFSCQISDIRYRGYSEGTETREDEPKKEIPWRFGSIEISLKPKEKAPEHKTFFVKAYFDEATVIPSMGLFRAVVRGDVEEAKKYDLRGKEEELGNELSYYGPEAAEEKKS